jgi:uncharacterized membrane protein (UPF0127 family)
MRIRKKIMLLAMLPSLVLAGVFVLNEYRVEARAEAEVDAVYTEKVTIKKQSGGKHVFTLEIADTPIDIQIGLMHRTSMPRDHGMLFLFPDPRETRFWMKNTKIPLDMLFVDADGKIINIHRRATPDSLQGVPSGGKVLGVIEINGGRADEVGIKIGDYVDHDAFGKPDASGQ